jgi:peptide/nickel transport system substrate-binding protein
MKNIIGLLAIALLTFSCGSESNERSQEGEGGIRLGGVFRVNEVMDIRSLYPLEITEVAAHRVASQVYESLIKMDQATLEPVASLAENWESNEDATEWTFRLRKGVYFHDDPCFSNGKGREVVAEDVAFVIRQLCTPAPNNRMFWLVRDRLKGARAYYDAILEGEEPASLEAIEVIDDYTIKIKLAFPFASFLRLMGHNAFYVYPKEALEMYGEDMSNKAIGTGPFKLKVFKRDEMVVLERNENYWGVDEHGNKLPYLDAIQTSFVQDKKSELLMFRNGELDMVFTLPLEMYDDVMGSLENANDERVDFRPQVKPSLSVHYYSFNHLVAPFDDVRVRKAFNLAVDRESLIRHTLQGEGTPGTYGIVPPVFPTYPYRALNGYDFDPEEARALLADAGYPDGKDFPTITLQTTSGGQNYELVAQVIQEMLKENLNIDVEMKVLTMTEQGEKEESGNSVFWRSAWLADYPDPENFLCLFIGEDTKENSSSYLNTVNYHSDLYDSLYTLAIRQLDEKERFQTFAEMDQLIINDAVVMPLYYEEFTRLIPRYVKGFNQNSMEYRDYTGVWMNHSIDIPEAKAKRG